MLSSATKEIDTYCLRVSAVVIGIITDHAERFPRVTYNRGFIYHFNHGVDTRRNNGERQW